MYQVEPFKGVVYCLLRRLNMEQLPTDWHDQQAILQPVNTTTIDPITMATSRAPFDDNGFTHFLNTYAGQFVFGVVIVLALLWLVSSSSVFNYNFLMACLVHKYKIFKNILFKHLF